MKKFVIFAGVDNNRSAQANSKSILANGPAKLMGGYLTNTNASARYLKLYDMAGIPNIESDCNCHRPTAVFLIPGNASGAGSVLNVPDEGLDFQYGIAAVLTTGPTDSDTGAPTANEVICNLWTS